MLSPNNPLRKPGYRFFLLLALAASTGGGYHFIASYWILYNETSSTSSIAWLGIAFFVPSIIILPMAGVILDRWNRRKMLAGLDVYFVVLNLVLIALMVTGRFKPGFLYVYGAFNSVGHALFWAALMAYLQQVLKKNELLHANSINTALFHGGYLLGAGTAGIFLPFIGAIGAFAVDALALSFCVFGWVFIKRWYPDEHYAQPRSRMLGVGYFREFLEGLAYIRYHFPLFLFTLLTIVPRIAAQMVNVLHVGFSKDILKTGSAGFGLMDMSYGLGAMICGACFPMLFQKIKSCYRLPFGAMMVAAAAAVFISFSNHIVSAMVGLLLFGASANIIGILANTILHRDVAPEVVGRVLSSVQICQYLCVPVLVWGLGKYAEWPRGRLVHELPLRDAYVAVALMFVLLGVLAWWITRNFERTHDLPSHPDPDQNS